MGNRILAITILAICLSTASCSENRGSSNELDGDTVIAVVNNEEVSLDSFRAELKAQKKKFRVQGTGEITPEELIWLKNRAVEQVVQRSLFVQEGKKNNIEVSQNELDEELLKIAAGYPEDSLKKQLDFEGLTRKEWEDIIKANLLTNKLIRDLVNSKVSISDEEMRSYFEANEASFHKGEQVRALHIMVETEAEIRQIQKEIRSKQKGFSDLAKEYSLGPEGVRGGDLGYFEVGQMPEEFDHVFKLKTNGVSDIIRTPYGFHLFKVVDKVEERKMSFDESRVQIERILLQGLQDKAFKEWLLDLKEKAVIELKYDSLEKIN